MSGRNRSRSKRLSWWQVFWILLNVAAALVLLSILFMRFGTKTITVGDTAYYEYHLLTKDGWQKFVPFGLDLNLIDRPEDAEKGWLGLNWPLYVRRNAEGQHVYDVTIIGHKVLRAEYPAVLYCNGNYEMMPTDDYFYVQEPYGLVQYEIGGKAEPVGKATCPIR